MSNNSTLKHVVVVRRDHVRRLKRRVLTAIIVVVLARVKHSRREQQQQQQQSCLCWWMMKVECWCLEFKNWECYINGILPMSYILIRDFCRGFCWILSLEIPFCFRHKRPVYHLKPVTNRTSNCTYYYYTQCWQTVDSRPSPTTS